ncbi:MAG: O-antigen ligase domain-containing protein, partial [Ignavibacteriales bacterium]
LLAALIITNSRSSILSFVISSAYIIYYFNRKLFNKILITSIVLLAILLFIPTINELISLLLRTDRIFSNTRGFFWSVAFDIIKDNPVFGAGPGVFEEYIYKYLPVNLGSFFEKQMAWAKSGTAHNFFLFRTADLGILGFITAIWLPILSIKLANKAIVKYKEYDREIFYLVVAIKGTIVGLIARAFFESTGLLTHGWITRDLPFWLLIVILLYLNKTETPNFKKLQYEKT